MKYAKVTLKNLAEPNSYFKVLSYLIIKYDDGVVPDHSILANYLCNRLGMSTVDIFHRYEIGFEPRSDSSRWIVNPAKNYPLDIV